MSKRLLLVLALSLLPLTAAADDTPAPDATNTPAASDTPAPSATPYDTAGALGPSTSAGALGPSAGSSSTNDSSTLQPAGNNPIQSTNNDSTGLTAPNGQSLQGAAPSNSSLNVIKGEADGSQHTPDSGPNYWVYLALAIAFGVIVAAIAWILRRRQPTNRPTPRRAAVAAPAKPEPTSSQRLRITINRPIKDVFEFALDPGNTPKWISVIKSEETSDWPAQNGTVYTNQDRNDNISEYRLSDLKAPHSFTLNKLDSTYHVRYEFSELNENSTEFEYYEWMDEGNLAQPFTTKELHELKRVLEAKPDGETPVDPVVPAKTDDTADEFTETDAQPAHDQPRQPGKNRHKRH